MRLSLNFSPLTLLCLVFLVSACSGGRENSASSQSQATDQEPASDQNIADPKNDSADATGSSQPNKTERTANSLPGAKEITRPEAPLLPPGEVMSSYLADLAPDGTANPPTVGRELHSRFSDESRDDSWADYVEGQVKYYFARQRQLDNYMTVAVQCRQTMCEILSVNKSPFNTSVDVDRWQDIVIAMKREPWYTTAKIQEPAVEFGSSGDGRVAILTYLIRG